MSSLFFISFSLNFDSSRSIVWPTMRFRLVPRSAKAHFMVVFWITHEYHTFLIIFYKYDYYMNIIFTELYYISWIISWIIILYPDIIIPELLLFLNYYYSCFYELVLDNSTKILLHFLPMFLTWWLTEWLLSLTKSFRDINPIPKYTTWIKCVIFISV